MAMCFAVVGLADTALAEDPSYITLGVGAWELTRSTAHAAEFNLGFRPDIEWLIFKPQAGVVAATDGDYFGYVGFLTDISLGEHLVLTPNVAAGGYGGHGYRLGSHVEFRSGADLGWRFEDASRFGIGFYHMSNAGLTNRNPGSESLLLEYFYPIDGLF
jgi:hypothetical protein